MTAVAVPACMPRAGCRLFKPGDHVRVILPEYPCAPCQRLGWEGVVASTVHYTSSVRFVNPETGVLELISYGNSRLEEVTS